MEKRSFCTIIQAIGPVLSEFLFLRLLLGSKNHVHSVRNPIWILDFGFVVFLILGFLEFGASSKLFGDHALSIHKTKQVIGLKKSFSGGQVQGGPLLVINGVITLINGLIIG